MLARPGSVASSRCRLSARDVWCGLASWRWRRLGLSAGRQQAALAHDLDHPAQHPQQPVADGYQELQERSRETQGRGQDQPAEPEHELAQGHQGHDQDCGKQHQELEGSHHAVARCDSRERTEPGDPHQVGLANPGGVWVVQRSFR